MGNGIFLRESHFLYSDDEVKKNSDENRQWTMILFRFLSRSLKIGAAVVLFSIFEFDI